MKHKENVCLIQLYPSSRIPEVYTFVHDRLLINQLWDLLNSSFDIGVTILLKAMDDIGVVMTPFGDVVTVILVANSYVDTYF